MYNIAIHTLFQSLKDDEYRITYKPKSQQKICCFWRFIIYREGNLAEEATN